MSCSKICYSAPEPLATKQAEFVDCRGYSAAGLPQIEAPPTMRGVPPLVTTKLLTTEPAQAITSTPGVAIGPGGNGYMVTFGTGKMLVPADSADSSVHYAYGIWDGAPAANTTLLTQALTEKTFSARDLAPGAG